MSTYQSKQQWMDSPAYQRLRRQCFRLQDWRCLDCERRHVPLELHHLMYHFGYQGLGAWGEESLRDVVGLCRDCHLSRHLDVNGDFWVDPDDKEAHWYGYWEELAKA